MSRRRIYADFDARAQATFLDLVAAGERLGTAARTVGVHPNTPSLHASRNQAFAERFATAKQRARAALLAKAPHGESRYTNHGCHCDTCRTAATAARTRRRNETKPGPDTETESGSSPIPFSPRNLACDPASRAA